MSENPAIPTVTTNEDELDQVKEVCYQAMKAAAEAFTKAAEAREKVQAIIESE